MRGVCSPTKRHANERQLSPDFFCIYTRLCEPRRRLAPLSRNSEIGIGRLHRNAGCPWDPKIITASLSLKTFGADAQVEVRQTGHGTSACLAPSGLFKKKSRLPVAASAY